ncbi:MAG: nucleotidyltransferase domain-containing protein [Roseburia sp.]|nr:nucleotidyltransferase domain-containing protein [Roseburia sp.]
MALYGWAGKEDTSDRKSSFIIKEGTDKMNNGVFTIKDIENLVQPIAEKYKVKAIYLFGSYARGEADERSDLDFLVYGGENFKLTMIFSLAEELRKILKKNVDVFEINEINRDSDFYNAVMRERLLIA